MEGFFNTDNGFMRAMSKLADIVILSLLWLLFSIPVFTIGASTTALYYTSVKVIRHDRDYVWKSFWKSFRENFADATVLWLLTAAVYVMLGINIWTSDNLFGDTVGFFLKAIYILMAILVSLMAIYIFPVQSRFVMKKGQVLKLSLFMGIRHLPFSVAMVLIEAAAAVAVYLIAPLILVMPVAATLFISFFMERILKKYMPEERDDNLDQWYLE